MRSALVCGAGGFIGGHLVKRLKSEGFWVRGVDLKSHEYARPRPMTSSSAICAIHISARHVVDRRYDEVYQLAADMGGAGFILTGENDADIMHNSAIDKPQSIGSMLQKGDSAHILLLFCMYLSGIQPARPEQPELRRELRLPCGAG